MGNVRVSSRERRRRTVSLNHPPGRFSKTWPKERKEGREGGKGRREAREGRKAKNG